eukprot:gene1601-3093_t
MRKDEAAQKASHLIKVLDFLVPILRLKIEVVKLAIDKFMMDADDRETAERSSVLVSKAIQFFPTCNEIVLPLLNLLADDIPYVGLTIRLLDPLTILTLFAQGSQMEKARLIFTWYNSSKNGIMSEVELRIFLTRTCNCFLRMKLINRIDFTPDDIIHTALLARATDGISILIPGFSFNDFFLWFSESLIAKALEKFLYILERLMNILHAFDECLIPYKWWKFHNKSLRVDIKNLEIDTDYLFKIYTDKYIFPPIAVRTMPSSQQLATKKEVCISILPSTMTAHMAEEYIAINPHIKSSDTIIFTGTICPIEQVLRQAIHIASVPGEDVGPSSSEYFAKVMTSIAENTYGMDWLKLQDRILKCRNITDHLVEGFLPAPATKQLVSYIGMGPWTHPEWREECRERIHKYGYMYLEKCLEGLYRDYARPTLPPPSSSSSSSSGLQLGTLKVLFVHNPSNTSPLSSLSIPSHDYLSAADIIPLLFSSQDSSNTDFLNNITNMLLIIRSPLDLLEPKDQWQRSRDGSRYGSRSRPGGKPSTTKTNAETDADAETALTGSHEIVYGEYTASDAASAASKGHGHNQPKRDLIGEDEIFESLCLCLLDWMAAGTGTGKGHSNVRKVTILSVGWHNGINFKVYRDSNCAIIHENLLATKTVATALTDEDPIVLRLQRSLPKDTVLAICPPSQDRSLTITMTSINNNINSNTNNGNTADSLVNFVNTKRIPPKPLIQEITSSHSNIKDNSKNNSKLTNKDIIPVFIVQGPMIHEITSTKVLISIRCQGVGYITCEIYNMPIPANYSDAHTLLKSDKNKLKFIQKIVKYNSGKYINEMLFQITDLIPFHNYCITIEPSVNKPCICTFKTLCVESSTSSTIITSTVNLNDYSLPSSHLYKINEYFDKYRSTTAPIYLQHAPLFYEKDTNNANLENDETNNATTTTTTTTNNNKDIKSHIENKAAGVISSEDTTPPPLKITDKITTDKVTDSTNANIDMVTTDIDTDLVNTGSVLMDKNTSQKTTRRRTSPLPLISMCDMDSLYRRTVAVHFGYHDDRLRTCGGVHVACNGKFCRIAPKDPDVFTGLLDVINALQTIDTYTEIISLSIFLPKPLIHYLKRDKTYGWITDDHIKRRREYIHMFLIHLFEWRRKDFKRDCQLFTSIDIKQTLCAIFQHRLKEFENIIIRHILLPCRIHNTSTSVDVILPNENKTYAIGSYVIYRIEQPLMDTVGVKAQSPKFDLYGRFKTSNAIPVFHILDIVTPHVERPGIARHTIVAKTVAYNIDCVVVLLGPVIGLVTTKIAKILFEFNTDIAHLKCALKCVDPKTGVYIDEMVETKKRIRPYRAIVFSFEGLRKGYKYDIFLPNIEGNNKCLGTFRTPAEHPPFIQLVITGDDQFENSTVLDKFIQQLQRQQGADIRHLLQDSANQNDEDFPPPINENEITSAENTWMTLYNHLRQPSLETSLVVNMQAHTLLNLRLEELIPVFLKQINNFELPLRNATPVSLLSYVQFEDNLRDTFRVMWTIPAIRSTLSSISNLFYFNSKYLLPIPNLKFDNIEEEDDVEGEAEVEVSGKSLAVIRKLFEGNVQTYLSSLTDIEDETGHRTILWTLEGLTLILFDISSNRRKSKKKKKNAKKLDDLDSMSGDTTGRPANTKITDFSPGFLDEIQWSLLKNILRDPNIIQLVLCCQLPFIPLYEIPETFPESMEKPGKGEIIPWQPTRSDLIYFFDLLFKWIRARPSTPARSVCLLCCADIAYTTTIQELWTGGTIQQVCIGKFNEQKSLNKKSEMNNSNKDRGTDEDTTTTDKDEIVLLGHLGNNMKYTHSLTSLHDVHISSSPERSGGGPLILNTSSDIKNSLESMSTVGFGLFRVWFDDWKANSSWTFILPNEISITGIEKDDNYDAVMTIGPVLGAPYKYEDNNHHNHNNSSKSSTNSNDNIRLMIPILIETNLNTILVITATDMFTSKIYHFTCYTKKLLPTILRLGPFEIGLRLLIQIESGIINRNDFTTVITTFYHNSDSNIVIINHNKREEISHTSEFTQDLINRSNIPYSGLSAILHINIQYKFEDIMNSFRTISGMNESLIRCFKDKIVPYRIRTDLFVLMDRLRNEFRTLYTRPSLRILYKKSYNLFMCKLAKRKYNSTDCVDILLYLISMRVYQEYIQQLSSSPNKSTSSSTSTSSSRRSSNNASSSNVFYAVNEGKQRVLPVSVISPPVVKIEEKREENRKARSAVAKSKSIDLFPKNKSVKTAPTELPIIVDEPVDGPARVPTIDPTLSPLDAVLSQWFQGLHPATFRHTPWRTANGNIVIDQICTPNTTNADIFCSDVERDGIHHGLRLVVIDGEGERGGAQDLFNDELQLGLMFQKSFMRWSKDRYDRELYFVCPSFRDGTDMRMVRRLHDGTATGIMMLESAFCSNNQIEKDKFTTEEQSSETAGASGKPESPYVAKKKKKSLDAMKKTKDGYVIIEAQTQNMKILEQDEVYTMVNSRILHSLPIGTSLIDEMKIYEDIQGERPCALDYIQLPPWLTTLSPAMPAIFIRDEIVFKIRNNEQYRAILDHIESNNMFGDIMGQYNRSKLSELSRPVNLREIDISSNESITKSFQNLCEQIWNECLLSEHKNKMFCFADEFVLHYICSHIKPSLSILSSPVEFATFFQKIIYFSTLLYFTYDIQNDNYLQHYFKTSEFEPIKTLNDESDLEGDPSPEELAEIKAKEKAAEKEMKKLLKSIDSKKGDHSPKKEVSSQDRYYLAKAELSTQTKERIMKRRFYGEKFKLDLNM